MVLREQNVSGMEASKSMNFQSQPNAQRELISQVLPIAGDRCYNCSQPGYMARDCQAPKFHSRTGRVCYNCGEPSHISKNCIAPHGGAYRQLVQGQARLNAIIPRETGFNEEEQQNMEGTLTLFHSRVRALFDTGALNSFIAVRMMNDLGLVPQEFETILNAV